MKITRSTQIAALAALSTLATNHTAQADVSGTYFHETDYGLEMIHIVEKVDGSLLGRMESYSFQPGQPASVNTHILEGAASKNEVILVFADGIQGGERSFSMSGEVTSNTLTLVWELDGYTLEKSGLSKRNELLERIIDQYDRNSETRQ